MTIFGNTGSLTAQRTAYKEQAFDLIFRQIARDLKAQQTTREVAIPAVAGLIAVATNSSGKGHAERMKDLVSEKVDEYLAILEENETAPENA